MSVDLQEVSNAYFGPSRPASGEYLAGLPARRKLVRIMVHWRILLFRAEAAEAIQAVTQNISSRGFYCICSSQMRYGESLICALEIPAHDPSAPKRTLALECRAKVLRGERLQAEETFGIACVIEDYRFRNLDG
jgi:hypothetical protein